MNDDDFDVVRSSGNVFTDFGDPDAETKLMKAKLAAQIIAALDAQQLTARSAAKVTGVTEADISRVRNADLSRFTLDRLLRLHRILEPEVMVELAFSKRELAVA
jgi:predicted XRE-type DNA-binding protein